MFTTVRTPRLANPPAVLDDIIANFRVQFKLTVTTGTPAFVGATQLRAAVPGMDGATGPVWSRFRINRIDVWGPDLSHQTPSGQVQSSTTIRVSTTSFGNTFFAGDLAAFKDTGVSGFRRAHVGIRPSLFQRAQWMDTQQSDSQSFMAVECDGIPDDVNVVTVQISVELRSGSMSQIK